jgi:NADH:ubiquinone oxidoreductase subunit K
LRCSPLTVHMTNTPLHVILNLLDRLVILLIGDLNIVLILFLLLFSSFLIHINTSLHLLLTAELLWITIYITTVLIGIMYDNLNILSLSFFVLVFSAVEFAVGLILLVLQHLFTRTLSLNEDDSNFLKFTNRIIKKNNVNRINWKF